MADELHSDSDPGDDARTGASRVVPSMFGHYRLTHLLGRGAFGEVYFAVDTVKNRAVALKLIVPHLSDDPTFRARMEREAITAGRLNDPHVVPIHDFGEVDGQLYVDMRMVSGSSLDGVLDREGTLEPASAVSIVTQVASALDAAHAEEITHRDVKPANILVTSNGFACLADFGLATAARDSKLTSPHTTIGTFAYMAPERITRASVDSRADVYSLTCVLYQCLTGKYPYPTEDATALCAAHLTAPIPKPSETNPDLTDAFDEVIATGMAKEPEERYQSAGELAAAAKLALAASSDGVGAGTSADHEAQLVADMGVSRRILAAGKSKSALAVATAAAVAAVGGVVGVTAGMRGSAQGNHAASVETHPDPSNLPPQVIATIPVGARPEAIAVDSRRQAVYSANYQSGTVSVIDAEKREVTDTVRVGGGPVEIALNSANSRACVTNNRDDTLSVIDTATNTVTATVPVGTNPWGVSIDGPADRAYVANMWDYTVSVISLKSFTVEATIVVGKNPYGVSVDSEGHTVYVANSSDNTISLISTDTLSVIATIQVPPDPRGIAIDPQSRTVYITHESQGEVSALDIRTRRVHPPLRVGGNPYGVTADPNSRTVYTANHDSAVAVIDTQDFQVRGVIRIGAETFALAVDPATHIIYTADNDNKVSVIEIGGTP